MSFQDPGLGGTLPPAVAQQQGVRQPMLPAWLTGLFSSPPPPTINPNVLANNPALARQPFTPAQQNATIPSPMAPPPSAPPTLPPPPNAPLTGAPDYSAANAALAGGPAGGNFGKAYSALAEGKPSQRDMGNSNVSAVLGGLASGAGGVNAQEAGSFAKALAMAGAGGEAGRNKAIETGMTRMQEYGKEKAGIATKEAESQAAGGREFQRLSAELGIHQADATEAAKRADNLIQYTNLKNAYDTNVTNALAAHDAILKDYNESKPEVKFDASGAHVYSRDPQTGALTMSTLPRTVMEKADDMSKVVKLTGGSDPMAEASYGHYILQTVKDPYQAQAAFQERVMRNLVQNGAAGPIFGQRYEEIRKKAQNQVPVQLQANPALYEDYVNKQIAAELLNKYRNQQFWIKKAADGGSPLAGALLGKDLPQQ